MPEASPAKARAWEGVDVNPDVNHTANSEYLPRRTRRGVSLLEVLFSMGVLMIGLLGVATLIPVGRFAVVEAGKADRSGACGHAAMREIKIRRMLDPSLWSDSKGKQVTPAGSFAIDPMGVAKERSDKLGPIDRITLQGLAGNLALAESIFTWRDELKFVFPEDWEPPPEDDSDRPRAKLATSGSPDFEGNYSWLVTVTPAAAEAYLPVTEKTLYSVSVAVCFKRDFSTDGERTAVVAEFYGGGWGGGSLLLDEVIEVKRNEWIMLCGAASGRTVCKWYRVVSVGELLVNSQGNPDPGGSAVTVLSLAGPDWDPTVAATAVVIDHVVGVYASTIELDNNLLWSK